MNRGTSTLSTVPLTQSLPGPQSYASIDAQMSGCELSSPYALAATVATDKTAIRPRTFDTFIVASNFLIHRVTAALQARGKGAVIGTDRLSLLLFVITTFLLLTPTLIPPSESTKERSGRRTDRCGFWGTYGSGVRCQTAPQCLWHSCS